jgi:hypothetical protein
MAKLDRLSRDVHFTSGLMAHKGAVPGCELGPDVDPFVLHLFAALVEKERSLNFKRNDVSLRAPQPTACPPPCVRRRPDRRDRSARANGRYQLGGGQ